MDRFTFDDLYVRRLKDHDRETGEHFVEYFSPRLMAKLHGRLPAQDVEDVRQDVLLRALAKLDDLRESCKLPSFVLGICDNILLERYRKVSRTEPLDDWILVLIGDWNVEDEFFKKEAAAAVRQTLSEMRGTREVEILRALLEDQNRDEICRRFNIGTENLRVVLHRARKRFAALFRRKNKA
jgi:RNA polymerase sigma factor (sigma-70 family)